MDDYRGIVLIRKVSAEEGTSLVQCVEDLFEGENEHKQRFNMAAWVNPDRGEMLFARRVAFVEGITEKLIFPYLANRIGCHSEDVSVIECGSKHNILLYVKIAKAFHLNYVVVHDEDPLPDSNLNDLNEDKVQSMKRTFALNEKIKTAVGKSDLIVVLRPKFEGCSGVSSSQADKKGKPLAALEHFSSVEPDDIPQQLANAVKLVYRET